MVGIVESSEVVCDDVTVGHISARRESCGFLTEISAETSVETSVETSAQSTAPQVEARCLSAVKVLILESTKKSLQTLDQSAFQGSVLFQHGLH